QNRCTWSIGELILIDGVRFAGVERMKRQQVQCAVRNYSDMRRPDFMNDRRHEFLVKPQKVTIRRFQYLARTGSHVVATQDELFELKREPLLKRHDFGRGTEMADYSGITARNNEGQDLVSSREIFDQCRSIRQQGAKRVQSRDG